MKMLYPNGDIYHGTNITLDLSLSKKKKKKKKKKVKPTYRPCFFSGKEPETQLFFFWPSAYFVKATPPRASSVSF